MLLGDRGCWELGDAFRGYAMLIDNRRCSQGGGGGVPSRKEVPGILGHVGAIPYTVSHGS